MAVASHDTSINNNNWNIVRLRLLIFALSQDMMKLSKGRKLYTHDFLSSLSSCEITGSDVRVSSSSSPATAFVFARCNPHIATKRGPVCVSDITLSCFDDNGLSPLASLCTWGQEIRPQQKTCFSLRLKHDQNTQLEALPNDLRVLQYFKYKI